MKSPAPAYGADQVGDIAPGLRQADLDQTLDEVIEYAFSG